MSNPWSVVRTLLAALILVAIGRQLWLHIELSYSALNFFSYFTNLSNLFAAFAMLLCAGSRSSSGAVTRDVVRYLAAVNMVIVGIVFVLLLRNVDLGALLPWVNVVLHYVMPVAIAAEWLIRPPSSKLGVKHFALALVFPSIYLLYVLLRGAAIGWYPYPFLNPANVGGYGGVALYAAGIFVMVLLIGGSLLAAGSRLSRAR